MLQVATLTPPAVQQEHMLVEQQPRASIVELVNTIIKWNAQQRLIARVVELVNPMAMLFYELQQHNVRSFVLTQKACEQMMLVVYVLVMCALQKLPVFFALLNHQHAPKRA